MTEDIILKYKSRALAILKKYWGYDSFREPQLKIISSALEGRDTLALLPTGGGKSICFQVPALIMEGLALIVSPLVALMEDQVSSLQAKGIMARCLHAGMRPREVDILLDNCIYGNVKMLYVSPVQDHRNSKPLGVQFF